MVQSYKRGASASQVDSMVSLTSSVEKRLNRNFIIFHPSDFSPASEIAFGHALKIPLQSKAKLDLMHVERSLSAEKSYLA